MPVSASVLQPFVCGGMSACLASAVVHPIDLSKVRLQLYSTLNPGKPKPAFYAILSQMIKNEGIRSIYAGLTAALSRQAVYGTARIGLHRTFSDMLVERNNGKPVAFQFKVLSGLCSGAIAVCIGTPFDVALVRMQADSMKPKAQQRGYTNVANALVKIFREEGFLKLYRSEVIHNIFKNPTK
jgi:solute carrier family 25 oxoglutarate transporter 11